MKCNKVMINKKEIKKNKNVKNTKIKIQRKTFNIFKVSGKFKLIPLIINILIPLVLGFIVSYLNKNSINTYEALRKALFTPPAIVFPIMWGILYILMGISAYRIYMKNKKGINDNGAYFIYLVNLIFNLIWIFIFLTFRLYAISFLWISILFVLAIITFVKFIRIDKIAGFLLIPYVIWTLFVGVLNYFIWVFNEM